MNTGEDGVIKIHCAKCNTPLQIGSAEVFLMQRLVSVYPCPKGCVACEVTA